MRVDRGTPEAAGRVPDLEVQVRAGGVALVADPGDLLAGADEHALRYEQVRRAHVPVDGVDVEGGLVVEDDPVPEAGGRAGADDHPVLDGVDRLALGCGEVDAVVIGPPPGCGNRRR